MVGWLVGWLVVWGSFGDPRLRLNSHSKNLYKRTSRKKKRKRSDILGSSSSSSFNVYRCAIINMKSLSLFSVSFFGKEKEKEPHFKCFSSSPYFFFFPGLFFLFSSSAAVLAYGEFLHIPVVLFSCNMYLFCPSPRLYIYNILPASNSNLFIFFIFFFWGFHLVQFTN